MAAPPEICPECGASVPRSARACPECGADEHTGWSERAHTQRLGIPDDEFDYEEFVREEFGDNRGRADRIKPRGMRWLWWGVAVVILVAIGYSLFRHLF